MRGAVPNHDSTSMGAVMPLTVLDLAERLDLPDVVLTVAAHHLVVSPSPVGGSR